LEDSDELEQLLPKLLRWLVTLSADLETSFLRRLTIDSLPAELLAVVIGPGAGDALLKSSRHFTL